MIHPLSGNRGEWSEAYVLLKLLADKKLHPGDGRLHKLDNLVMPILAVIREEQGYINEYTFSNDNREIIIKIGGKSSYLISVAEFKIQSRLLFQRIINSKKGKGSFCIPETEEFLRLIGCTKLKADSQSKSDIHIVIHDANTGACPKLGFSIKSELGSKSTLFNASQATNFSFELVNFDRGFLKHITGKETKSFAKKIDEIEKSGTSLKFSHIQSSKFSNNLILVDSALPQILANMVYQHYSGKASDIVTITKNISKENPISYDQIHQHDFYGYKIKRFLSDVALGMTPTKIWQGKLDATGGYLIVRQDGEMVCYHIIHRNEFEDYLFFNTKLDTPSSKRNKFGTIYEKDNKYLLDLNLQIRFK